MKKLVLLLLVGMPLMWATAQKELVVVNHDLEISGTSTLKDWTMDVEKLDVVGQAVFDSEGNLSGFKDVVVTVDVKSIKSGTEAMDQNTYEALKAEEYPQISFNLADDVTLIKQTSDLFMAICRGQISIAGTTKSLSFQAQGRFKGANKIELKGSEEVKMTDFNVDPPTFLLGANRTGDKIGLDLKLTLAMKATTKESVGEE